MKLLFRLILFSAAAFAVSALWSLVGWLLSLPSDLAVVVGYSVAVLTLVTAWGLVVWLITQTIKSWR